MKVDSVNLGFNSGVEKPGNELVTEENNAETTKKREEKIINSVCSFQSRMGPPEYRKWRRMHGLQFPLHPQQVAGWFILLAVGAASFFVLIPALRSFFRECLFAVLATLFILHVLSHLTALLLDPADPELRALRVKLSVPEFDRSKHAHVIENGRCHLCNIKTSSPKTKHCSVCNKCIDHFDHHCKWLNHCIGGRNYVAFLICVVTAVAASLVVVGVSVLEIVFYHVDPGLLSAFAGGQNGTAPQWILPDSVFLGIVSILGLLAATTAGLLLHLCLFHCYISVLGITTYEYIRNYRQEPPVSRPFSWSCENENAKVLTSQAESSLETRSDKCTSSNWCYYSCSRPPEDDANDFRCFPSLLPFYRTSRGSRKLKQRTLQRQNTDPEFVDRVIKPFLITLSDEKTERTVVESESSRSCAVFFGERKCGYAKKCDTKTYKKNCDRPGTTASLPSLKFLRPKTARPHSSGGPETSTKVKLNQIQPSNLEELTRSQDKISVIRTDYKAEGLDLSAFTTMETKVLPELNDSLKRLRSADELKQLGHALDVVERPRLGFHSSATLKKSRNRTANKRPRSPLLSPIKESELSNPGSPRVDTATSLSPPFVRPQTPETSMIFLSNPNSPSSSEEEEFVSPPTPIIHRHYDTEDILKTPQLPRKVYAASKEEFIFIVKPSKLKSNKWIDVEIKN